MTNVQFIYVITLTIKTMKDYICGYIVKAEGPTHAQIVALDAATSFSQEDYICVSASISSDLIPFIIGIILGAILIVVIKSLSP